MTHDVVSPQWHTGTHRVDGQRCWAMGHCGQCGKGITITKLGKYIHVKRKAAKA